MNDKKELRSNVSYLSSISFQEGISECMLNHRYRVGVYLINKEHAENFIGDIEKGYYGNCLPCIKRLYFSRSRYSYSYVEFLNGSIIQFMTANCNAIGIKFNMALIEKGIVDLFIHNIVYPSIASYNPIFVDEFCTESINAQQSLEDDTALNEFLCSFKINDHT